MTVVLTDEQRRVVDHPLGPVRVAAGAGTGKTTTLAARVVALVTEGGIPAEAVLGITFTNKAAQELADRIRAALAGTIDPGHEVEIHTYHGFAARILEEFGALVGVERGARLITPTYERQLLRQALLSEPVTHLDLTNPHLVEACTRLAGQLADHLLDPETLLDPDGDGPADRERAELARAVLRYREEKRRLDVIDYGDLIVRSHRLVAEHPEIAARIAGRYGAVFLDEYQDTNPAQRELLRALFPPGFPVTAVGDPDQTIYEWRGASLQNFARFPEHFPESDGADAPTVTLTLNRRSGANILRLANLVRERIDRRASAPLRPLPDAPQGLVAVHWARTAVDEAAFVAERLRTLHDSGRRWSDMAVLFRKNKDIALLYDALEEEGIPSEVANLGGLLRIPEVMDLVSWLRILGDPEDGPALLRVLMGSRFRLGMSDLAPLASWVRATSEEGDEPRGGVPGRSLLEAIDHLEDLALDGGAAEALTEFRALYRALLRAAQGESLVELVREILSSTGAWQEVDAMSDAARTSARINLYRFLDLAEEWSPLEGVPSLTTFLEYLSAMQEEQAEELDQARLSGEDAVALLTVHRAKGLEWPVVFLPALYRGNFPSHARAYEDPATRPEVLPFERRLDSGDVLGAGLHSTGEERRQALRNRHLSQEWRTAYVAVTRAAEELCLTGAFWYGYPEPHVRPSRPSELYEMAAALEGALDLGSASEEGARPTSLRLDRGTSGTPDPAFPGGWDEGLRLIIVDPSWARDRAEQLGVADQYETEVSAARQMLLDLPEPLPDPLAVEPLSTSVTGLVTYASCPRRYFWSEVDRLPRRPSPAARRGVELHRRIELHHQGRVPLDDLGDETYDLAPRERGSDGPDPFTAFVTSRFARLRPALVEAPFDLLVGGEAHVRGRIDAVYVDGDAWEVVDFKSGRPWKDPAGRVQLQAYALAISDAGLAPRPPESLTVTFAYLGDGLEERTEHVDAGWLDEARARVGELVAAIGASAWDPAPGHGCRACDFLRFCPAGGHFLAGEAGP